MVQVQYSVCYILINRILLPLFPLPLPLPLYLHLHLQLQLHLPVTNFLAFARLAIFAHSSVSMSGAKIGAYRHQRHRCFVAVILFGSSWYLDW